MEESIIAIVSTPAMVKTFIKSICGRIHNSRHNSVNTSNGDAGEDGSECHFGNQKIIIKKTTYFYFPTIDLIVIKKNIIQEIKS